jgi:two-component system NtrC family sensor kinase
MRRADRRARGCHHLDIRQNCGCGMIRRPRLTWFGLAALAVVSVSVLGFLFVRVRTYDASSYFQHLALLHQLNQLDVRWELDVLKARMGTETPYDSLVDPLKEFHLLWDRLQVAIAEQREPTRTSLARVALDYHREIEEKARLIDKFKIHNALLGKTLATLPISAAALEHALDTGGRQNVAPRIGKALLGSIIYSGSPTDDQAADIDAMLSQLAAAVRSPTGPEAEAMQNFVTHARTVLREQPEVNSLVASIATVPSAASLAEIDAMLSTAKRRAEIQAQQDRRNLLIFAAGLMALLLYAAVNLIRSHAIINRVNRELHAANEGLEARVEERTEELRAAQSELVSIARHTGMAEIATNVLHNVGNALNSIVVSAGIIDAKIRESKTKRLADAVNLMNQHAADLGEFMTRDERGKALPGYFSKVVDILAEERGAATRELESLVKGIDHIRDIVAKQQSYAGTVTMIEPIRVSELIEDALRMSAGSLARRQVEVVKQWPDLPELLLDKQAMLQLLVNLITNALQAMDSVTDRAHRLTLKMQILDAAAERRLSISVEDNGVGIAPGHLPKLFTHGFTTRKKGHGFGLHSCALAARSMEGRLTAHSDGRGQGAIFTLDLPLREVSRKTVVNG